MKNRLPEKNEPVPISAPNEVQIRALKKVEMIQLANDWENYKTNESKMMSLAYDMLGIEDVSQFRSPRPVKPVIIAAGKGVRWQKQRQVLSETERGKIAEDKNLVEINGKPSLIITLGNILALRNAGVQVEKPIMVVSPDNRRRIEKALAGKYDVEFVIQEEAKGSGHAVLQTQKHLEDFQGDVIVAWASHPTVTQQTLLRSIIIHQAMGDVAMTVPAAIKHREVRDQGRGLYDPLIRDRNGRVIDNWQRHLEKRAMPECGEDDVGAFIVKGEELFDTLYMAHNLLFDETTGRYTKAHILLPALGDYYDAPGELGFPNEMIRTLAQRRGKLVLGLAMADPREAFGIKELGDIAVATRFVRELSNISQSEPTASQQPKDENPPPDSNEKGDDSNFHHPKPSPPDMARQKKPSRGSGNPADLLLWMLDNKIYSDNPKKARDMARKRDGEADSLRNIQREVRVLLDVNLLEEKPRDGYYLPEWLKNVDIKSLLETDKALKLLKKPSRSKEEIKKIKARVKALRAENRTVLIPDSGRVEYSRDGEYVILRNVEGRIVEIRDKDDEVLLEAHYGDDPSGAIERITISDTLRQAPDYPASIAIPLADGGAISVVKNYDADYAVTEVNGDGAIQIARFDEDMSVAENRNTIDENILATPQNDFQRWSNFVSIPLLKSTWNVSNDRIKERIEWFLWSCRYVMLRGVGSTTIIQVIDDEILDTYIPKDGSHFTIADKGASNGLASLALAVKIKQRGLNGTVVASDNLVQFRLVKVGDYEALIDFQGEIYAVYHEAKIYKRDESLDELDPEILTRLEVAYDEGKEFTRIIPKVEKFIDDNPSAMEFENEDIRDISIEKNKYDVVKVFNVLRRYSYDERYDILVNLGMTVKDEGYIIVGEQIDSDLTYVVWQRKKDRLVKIHTVGRSYSDDIFSEIPLTGLADEQGRLASFTFSEDKPPDMVKKVAVTPMPESDKALPKVKIKDFRFKGQKINVDCKLFVIPDGSGLYYLATFNLNGNYAGHIHVHIYNNGELESFSCNDIFVIRDLREQGLGSEILLKTFLAAAKEAKLRGIKPAKWVSVYYGIIDDGNDDDWEFHVVPLIELLRSLGFDDYLIEFDSGKLRDRELIQLMEKHSKRDRKLQGTYYNTLNNLRLELYLKMIKKFFIEIFYAIWSRLQPTKPEAPITSARQLKEKEDIKEQASNEDPFIFDDCAYGRMPGMVRGSGWAVLSMLLFSVGWVLSKYILKMYIREGISPGLRIYISSRYMLTLAVFATFWLLVFHIAKFLINRTKNETQENLWDAIFPDIKLIKTISPNDKKLILKGATCIHIIGGISYYIGLSLLSTRLATIIFQSYIPFSFRLGKKRLNEKITKAKKIGTLMILGGVFTIIGISKESVTLTILGLIFGSLAMFCCAYVSAYQQVAYKDFFDRHPEERLKVVKFGYLLAIVPVSIFILVLQQIVGVSGFPIMWHSLIFLGTSIMFPLAFYFQFKALGTKDFDATHLPLIMSCSIIVTTLLEGLFLHNWPKHLVLFILMSALVIFGAYVATRKKAGTVNKNGKAGKENKPLGFISLFWQPLINRGWISLETAARWSFTLEEGIFSLLFLSLPWFLATLGFLDNPHFIWFYLASSILYGISHTHRYHWREDGTLKEIKLITLKDKIIWKTIFTFLGAAFRSAYLIPGIGPIWAPIIAFVFHAFWNNVVTKIWKKLPVGMAKRDKNINIFNSPPAVKRLPLKEIERFEKSKFLEKKNLLIPMMFCRSHGRVYSWIKWLQKQGLAYKNTTIINFDDHGDIGYGSNPRVSMGNWMYMLRKNEVSTGRCIWVRNKGSEIHDPDKKFYGQNNLFDSIEKFKKNVSGPAIITIDYDFIAPYRDRNIITDEDIDKRVAEIVDALFSANIVPVAINFTYTGLTSPAQTRRPYLAPRTKNKITQAFIRALKRWGIKYCSTISQSKSICTSPLPINSYSRENEIKFPLTPEFIRGLEPEEVKCKVKTDSLISHLNEVIGPTYLDIGNKLKRRICASFKLDEVNIACLKYKDTDNACAFGIMLGGNIIGHGIVSYIPGERAVRFRFGINKEFQGKDYGPQALALLMAMAIKGQIFGRVPVDHFELSEPSPERAPAGMEDFKGFLRKAGFDKNYRFYMKSAKKRPRIDHHRQGILGLEFLYRLGGAIKHLVRFLVGLCKIVILETVFDKEYGKLRGYLKDIRLGEWTESTETVEDFSKQIRVAIESLQKRRDFLSNKFTPKYCESGTRLAHRVTNLVGRIEIILGYLEVIQDKIKNYQRNQKEVDSVLKNMDGIENVMDGIKDVMDDIENASKYEFLIAQIVILKNDLEKFMNDCREKHLYHNENEWLASLAELEEKFRNIKVGKDRVCKYGLDLAYEALGSFKELASNIVQVRENIDSMEEELVNKRIHILLHGNMEDVSLEGLKRVKPSEYEFVDAKELGSEFTTVRKIHFNGRECIMKFSNNRKSIGYYIIPEAKILHKINSKGDIPCLPKIVALAEFPEGGIQGIIFEKFPPGMNLWKYVKKNEVLNQNTFRHEYLSEIEALDIAIKVAKVLKNNIHKQKIIHRDIKPNNIYIKDDGNIIIYDFGISVPIEYDWEKDPRKLKEDMFTFGFVPDDIIKWEAIPDLSDDMYALSATLRFMLVGPSSPIVHEAWDPQLRDIINKATHTDRGQRYHNIKEMLRDLKRCRRALKRTQSLSKKGNKLDWRIKRILGLPSFSWKDFFGYLRYAKFGKYILSITIAFSIILLALYRFTHEQYSLPFVGSIRKDSDSWVAQLWNRFVYGNLNNFLAVPAMIANSIMITYFLIFSMLLGMHIEVVRSRMSKSGSLLVRKELFAAINWRKCLYIQIWINIIALIIFEFSQIMFPNIWTFDPIDLVCYAIFIPFVKWISRIVPLPSTENKDRVKP